MKFSIRFAGLALAFRGTSADECQDFCVNELSIAGCTKGSWCDRGRCHSLFWASESKLSVCVFTGDGKCSNLHPVSCEDAESRLSSTTEAPPTELPLIQQCINELITILGVEKVLTERGSIPEAYNKVFGSYVPAVMVLPENGADVSIVLNTAQKHGVKVAVRSFAGHSYVGQSSIGSDGILMNMMNMNTFRIEHVDGRYVAIVGPGLAQLEIYSRLAMHDPPLGLNGGTCPSVALSGLVSGGGEGMTSSFGGITSDRLLSAKIVAWTGDSYEETDAPDELMFALRGGMGGNYGVVTEWRMNVFTTASAMVFSYRFRPTDKGYSLLNVQKMARDFQASMRSLSDNSVWGMVKFLAGGTVKFVGQCICPDNICENCSSFLNSMQRDVLPGAVGGAEIQSFGEAMWSWAGCTEWGGIDAYPAGGLTDLTEEELKDAMKKCYSYDHQHMSGPYKSRSLYMPDESRLDGSFEETALDFVTNEAACKIDGAQCFVQLSYVGGAMIEPHSNSAFVHRTPGSHLQILVYWPVEMDSGTFIDWSRRARAAFLPMSIHESYQNYPDSEIPAEEWPKLYFGTTGVYERLIDLKCKYNPTGVMDLPHAAGATIPITRC